MIEIRIIRLVMTRLVMTISYGLHNRILNRIALCQIVVKMPEVAIIRTWTVFPVPHWKCI